MYSMRDLVRRSKVKYKSGETNRTGLIRSKKYIGKPGIFPAGSVSYAQSSGLLINLHRFNTQQIKKDTYRSYASSTLLNSYLLSLRNVLR